MTNTPSKNVLVIGIAPSSRGVGFAVVEGAEVLIDWGVKTVKGDKNARCMSHVGNLINRYEPDVIAIEDARSGIGRRSPRVQVLLLEIADLARRNGIELREFSRKHMTMRTLGTKRGTKDALAEHIATVFPEELGFRLPGARRPWMSVDSRMDIFDAVALAHHCLDSLEATAVSSVCPPK